MIPGACWPASLTISLSSRFSERFYFKNKKWRRVEEDTQYLLSGLHMHVYAFVQAHKQKCSQRKLNCRVSRKKKDGVDEVLLLHYI